MILPKDKSGKTIEFFNINDRKPWVENEEGLLGLAFHPNFKSNQKFYAYYSAGPQAQRGSDHCVEVRQKGGHGRSASCLSFLSLIGTTTGVMVFGKDNKLYISSGDAASQRPARQRAELNNLLGNYASTSIAAAATCSTASRPTTLCRPQGHNRKEIWAYGRQTSGA